MSGWIKLHRQFIKWEWFTDVNTCHLFTYLLLEANHKETKWRGHVIMPGQLLTGRIKLAEATGLSQQKVRTSLDKLKSTNEVTSKIYNKYSIITITNWAKYYYAAPVPVFIDAAYAARAAADAAASEVEASAAEASARTVAYARTVATYAHVSDKYALKAKQEQIFLKYFGE